MVYADFKIHKKHKFTANLEISEYTLTLFGNNNPFYIYYKFEI